MPSRERLESVALVAGALLLMAFVASFAFGLLETTPAHETAGGTEPSRLPDVELPAVARGRVEVLNGSGRSGLARHATDLLRNAGFDVVYFGNAAGARDSSVVIDRVGKTAVARAAADELGISLVRSEADSTLLLDATIILGKAWAAPQK